MFEPTDNIPESGSLPMFRRGSLMLVRVAWQIYRSRMIQFAKYVVIENLNSTASIEEIVDAWLNRKNESLN